MIYSAYLATYNSNAEGQSMFTYDVPYQYDCDGDKDDYLTNRAAEKVGYRYCELNNLTYCEVYGFQCLSSAAQQACKFIDVHDILIHLNITEHEPATQPTASL